MIDINNLYVKLGSGYVLNDISLKIENKNKVIGLFGPNGAGKTTLLNTLTGIINKFQGSIHCPDKSEVSYLPDAPFLYKFMTLKQAICYYSDAYGDLDVDKAHRLFEQLGLELKQKISQCSKGMSEQIHLILTICRNVSLYILDEPLAAVDPLTRDYIIKVIKSERYPNSTVLISTHLISDVEELFDEVIMIKNGAILLYEDVKTLKSNSSNSLETIFKEKLR